MSAFSDIDIDHQEAIVGKSLYEFHEQFPGAPEEQLDPLYLKALHQIAKVEGAGRFALVIDFVAELFGKNANDVLRDAICEVPA